MPLQQGENLGAAGKAIVGKDHPIPAR